MSIYDECIEWDGPLNSGRSPYGRIAIPDDDGIIRRRKAYVHRLVWIEENGPIPTGMCVLHKCDNPPCINIDHLFLGTQSDNIDDMVRKGRHVPRSIAQTHCKHGHAFSQENTYLRKDNVRACKTCMRASKKRLRAKKGAR